MTRIALLLAAAVLPFPALAQQAATNDQAPLQRGRDVVVTGRRLSDTDAALKACLARHCPPDQDIDSSIAHAENLFVAGDYRNARSTLHAAIGRNARFAKAYPVPVADLYRSDSRIAIHVGETDEYRVNAIASLDALKAGLPDNDPRVLVQRIEVADAFAHLGRYKGALAIYRDVVAKGRALNLPQVEGYGLLRTAVLYTALSTANEGQEFRESARRAIRTLTETTDPRLAVYREATTLLSAWVDGDGSKAKTPDRLVAAFSSRPTPRPMLIYAPPIQQADSLRAFRDGNVLSHLPTQDADGQWADVSFWVKPDGTVSDADILRGSAVLNKDWLQPVLKSINGRRYAPLAAGGDPGMLRVERYTRTAHILNPDQSTGTHLRTRQAYPRIEVIDLTEEAAVASPTSKG